MSVIHILESISDRQRKSLYEYLQNIYLLLEQDFKSMDQPCTQCGQCCDFDAFGHKLYVSSLEFLYVSEHVKKEVNWKEGTCPFLKDHSCKAREFRMLGCRTFFRLHSKKDEERSQALYEHYLQKIKDLYRDHGIPWEYKDYLVFVEEAKKLT